MTSARAEGGAHAAGDVEAMTGSEHNSFASVIRSNPASITPPLNSPVGSTSALVIDDLPGMAINDVDVVLNGVRADEFSDLRITITGPNDETVTLVAGACYQHGTGPTTYTINDDALRDFPQLAAGCGPGQYRGTDHAELNLPTRLSVFNGLLANGAWRVKVVDAAGANTDSYVSGGYSLRITGAPIAQIDQGPTSPSGSSVDFSYSSPATGVAAFECFLDGTSQGDQVPCPSVGGSGATQLLGLADGPHTFAVRAVDAQGSKGPFDSHAWTVGSTTSDGAPETRIDDPKPTSPWGPVATYRFSSPDADVEDFVCFLDGVTPAHEVECTGTSAGGSVQFAGMAEGTHRFAVAAVDADGNVDASPAAHEWTVAADAPGGAPVARFDVVPVSPSAPTVEFRYSSRASDVAGFECFLDGADAAHEVQCPGVSSGTVTLSGLANGDHSFRVRAVDSENPTRKGPFVAHDWSVETSPSSDAPDTRIDDPKPVSSSGSRVTFRYSSPEPGVADYICTLTGIDPVVPVRDVPCTGVGAGGSVTISELLNGAYVFSVAAVDGVGRVDDTPATHAWKVARHRTSVSVDARQSPGLQIAKSLWKGKRAAVVVRGAPTVTGPVTAVLKGKVKKPGDPTTRTRTFALKRSGQLRAGQSRLVFELAGQARLARQATITVSYAGTTSFEPQRLMGKIKNTARRVHLLKRLSIGNPRGGSDVAKPDVEPSVTVTLRAGTARVARLAYGQRLTLTGVVTNGADSEAVPLANRQLEVTRQFRGSSTLQMLAPVTTDAAGRFSYSLEPGPSSTVEFSVPGTEDYLPSQAAFQTLVGGKVTLKAVKKGNLRRQKQTLVLAGNVVSKPIPEAGVKVTLQRQIGKKWKTIKSTLASTTGSYRTRFTLRTTGGPETFRAVLHSASTYAYEKATSSASTVIIR